MRPDMPIDVPIERLAHGRGLPLPERATTGSAGFDLVAAVETETTLARFARLAVPTGLRLALPHGIEGQVRPRSGLALRHGVTVVNAPGTIDSDYRGELMVALINLGDADFIIERGMRIAQLVLAPVLDARFHEGETAIPVSARGAGGFGSTGMAATHAAAEKSPNDGRDSC